MNYTHMITIPTEEYKELIRTQEKMRILEEYLQEEKITLVVDVKRILGIKETENDNN